MDPLDGHYPALTRRDFLRAAGVGLTGAGAAAVLGCGGDDGHSPGLDGEPEVTSIRLSQPPPACVSAQYLAERYLQEEGFTDVEYVPIQTVVEVPRAVSSGLVDFTMIFAGPIVGSIDRGEPLSVLAGMHVGCFQVIASGNVTDIGQLRGRRIGVSKYADAAADYSYFVSMFQYLGLQANRDVTFVEGTPAESIQRLATGEVDAVMAFPPATQELRAKGIGHVILDSVKDPPYSQYFCCLVAGNKGFIQKHPAATKRIVRAFIRGAQHSASRPDEVADFLVDRAIMNNRDHARQMMRSLPYDVWNRYDPADTLRFYALQLREAGVIKSTPDDIIKNGTDFRFLNELKREMAYFPPADPTRSAFALDCDIEPPAYGPTLTRGAESGTARGEAPS